MTDDYTQALSDRAHERAERFKPNVRQHFFPLTMLESLTFLGSFSWTNPSLKMRFLHEPHILNFYGVPQTPPELARDYLTVKYSEKRRHTVQQFAAINDHRSQPLYCRLGKYPDMVYLDVKSAYWRIVEIVGWNVDYNPSRWLGKKSDMLDFPYSDNKLIRNCLVTAGLLTKRPIWTGTKLRLFKAHNPLVNYDLWALAQDVLHSLAHLALLGGAVYIHTDGYIVPRRMAKSLADEIAHWGFATQVKAEGDAEVYGIGAYKVGDTETKHRKGFLGAALNTISEPDIRWLRFRIHKLATTKIDW